MYFGVSLHEVTKIFDMTFDKCSHLMYITSKCCGKANETNEEREKSQRICAESTV